jgi:hypothetical protein
MLYRKLRTIAGRGNGPDRFVEALRGIAIDTRGRILAVGDLKIAIFTADGQLVQSWDTAQPGYSVTVAADGTICVGEEARVELAAADGSPLDTWHDPARLGRITTVAVTDDAVLLGDATNRCIHRYDRRGKFLNDIGKDNKMRGFMLPNGHMDFAVGSGGTIHLAHSGKHRVERYAQTGELLGQWGRFDGVDPAGFAGCCNPTNLALTAEGNIVVTEKAPPRVKLYDTEGKLRAVFGEKDFNPSCKNMDVAVDPAGRIHVVDTAALQVVVYEPEQATPATQPELSGADRGSRPVNGATPARLVADGPASLRTNADGTSLPIRQVEPGATNPPAARS